jgi:choline dehydrogenase-like flavoprotein
MSDKKATGIMTIAGKSYLAKKDVILAAGALNSPQLLMLSGIGPASELQKHSIPLIHDLPDVGKHLQDHCFSTATLLQTQGTNDRMAFETDEKAVAAAREQYSKDKTGLMSEMYCSTPMGWFKNEKVIESAEFKALDKRIQDHIKKPTVPVYEIATHTPPLFTGDYVLKNTDCYLTALGFVMSKPARSDVY